MAKQIFYLYIKKFKIKPVRGLNFLFLIQCFRNSLECHQIVFISNELKHIQFSERAQTRPN